MQIDFAKRRVLVDGLTLKVGDRAFDLLAALAARPGRVLSAAELTAKVWPGRVVEDNNLRVQIRALRKMLGAELIVNVAGRGYALAPNSAATPPRGGAVPRWPEPMLGRDSEFAQLAALQAEHRLITLVGPGGIGKTRLAMALAEQARPLHDDGVCWVDLAPLTAPVQLAPAIAQALGLQTGPLDGADAALRLAPALAGLQVLLVLDTAELLVEALAPLLAALLQAAPQLRLLVTSQRRLHVPGEQVFMLAPLAVPAPGATRGQMRGAAALQLLERRAQAADAAFSIADADLEAACALCRRLDGLALALEMAGARLPLLGARALDQHLDERLQLLGDEGAVVPHRHRSLRAALDWSHAMLPAAEQAALRRLAVFAAPFRLPSAQQVVAETAAGQAAVLQDIIGLAGSSMLQVQPGEPRRYRLLESTRLYAQQALAEHGETAALHARHAQAMGQLAEQAQAAYWTSSDGDWLATWRADHADLLLGFDRACAVQDPEAAAAIGEALHAMANLTGDYGPVRSRTDAALGLLSHAGPLARARLWNRLATLAAPGLTRRETALRRVEAWRAVADARGLSRESEAARGLSRALAHLTMAHEHAGDAAAADATLAEVAALDDARWPPRQRVMGLALARFNLAAARGDAVALRDNMQAWLDLAAAGGLQRIAAQAHNNLAQAALLDGRAEEALAVLRIAAAEYRALGCSLDVGVNLGCQAEALLACGDAAAARDAIEQALMLVSADDDALLAFVDNLAPLALQLGRAQDGARMLAAARALRQRRTLPHKAFQARRAAAVDEQLRAALGDAAHAQALASGARLDTPGLHQTALDWLHALR